MDNILSWFNIYDWIERTLLTLQINGEVINISTYGRVKHNGQCIGTVKYPLVYKLIDQYGIASMEGDYTSAHDDSLFMLYLQTPGNGQWTIKSDALGPPDLNRFVVDLKQLINQLKKDH